MARGWDVIQAFVRMPGIGQTVNTESFSVPRIARSIALHIPALAGAATVKLQSLDPSNLNSDTWRDVATYNLTTGATQLLTGIPGNQVTTIPTTATGGGNLRLVASADQSASPVNITVSFMLARL